MRAGVCVVCGDGIVDDSEECDDGEGNGTSSSSCRTTCVLAACGDGMVDEGEECDEGQSNSDEEPGACRTSCLLPFCGDGVVDDNEECDEGADTGVWPSDCQDVICEWVK